MALIADLLLQRAGTTPERPAFFDACDGAALTWGGLARHVERWQQLSTQRELRRGTRIALVVEDPLAFAASYLACLAVGLCAAPVDARAPRAEVEATVARLRAEVVASDRAELFGIEAGVPPGCERWHVDRRGVQPVAIPARRHALSLALRPAALLTSSGTTGVPKGIPLSEFQLLAGASRIAAHHGLSETDRGYSPLPLFHVNAQVVALLTTLVTGGQMAFDRRFEREAYWGRVVGVAPTWLNTVPAILAAAAAEPIPLDVTSTIRFARSASAPLPLGTLRDFERESGISVLETYGMTEAASQITANPPDAAARRPGSVGLAVGLELRVSEHDTALPAGEIGLVELRGMAVVEEYLELAVVGDERRRPARSRSGWLTTGDLGYLDEEGYLFLLGRSDDVINRGGDKLRPEEVEAVLLEEREVVAAAVVGRPHETLGQVPVAAVVAAGGAIGLRERLEARCRAELVRWKQPVDYRFVEALPVGPTGKVLRRVLRDALADRDELVADAPVGTGR